ncbi:adaptin N terminal region-domain-containing protein [Lobosporangium transversale]|uniref:Adaptin N terminal region-domain-containing protein n=1 Tax=Lobosporangium transversale TaxID=64571 RepID=A0A1Y2GFL3_9FUNG|nr:adaptin N terminal region-domain-containing protein [Lobosporangium transversale]ORZ09403.1 adaptin N terminal region-domain-containing protein [Lobosporangium transversale]|eukprot:XP_021878856.1 adaptin N terminal region-domain-containing protein [Lobosporangium transversale]
MYNVDAYLKTLTSNAVKLSKKVQDGIVENTRDFRFENQAHFLDTNEDKMREIRKNLDSKYEKEKLDGLKRLIAMISKGRDVSEFFPDVVKNVASTSLEVRKLVYIYILRYAEQEQDLALLSINTFQKDLSDKNQLIRAMALRVMSGIRVPVISPIVMLGIKKCVTDLSPYVRKIAAHAIPKCYQLDPAQKEALIDIISTMLGDNSTFTIGSVIMAFNHVCPDRLDLIHPQYRKLCRMLVDMDEWGQITAIDLLLRYSRTQFLNPIGKTSAPTIRAKKEKSVVKSFYSDDDSDISHHSSDSNDSSDDDSNNTIDPDLAFLLKCALPLLQSRNSQVVLSVAKLFMHLAPAEDCYKIGRPLIRLLRSHREIQYVVLNNIVAIASERPYIFDQFYQHFFVRSTDPIFIRNLKLDILTMIATESNITFILRELQEYVKSSNKDFVTQAIEAIGRCASNIPEMAHSCLGGLLKLSYSKSDSVAAESVVAIRRLLQQRPGDSVVIITQLARGLDDITESLARANIFWLVGQHCEQLPTIAPDVLRKAAKSFCSENETSKLQILTLGGKLVAQEGTSSKTINLLFQYVLNMARYDLDYIVRDRARFLRGLVYGGAQNNTAALASTDVDLEPEQHENGTSHDINQDDGDTGGFEYNEKALNLSDHAKAILLSEKPAPERENPSHGREQYKIGSMSLVLNRVVAGYEPLPDWPTTQPDPSVRRLAATMEAPGYMNDRTGFGSDSFYPQNRQHQMSSSASPSMGSRYDRGAQSLDKFYESSEEETSSEEGTSSESEKETGEEGTSEESGSSESESEDGEDDDDDEEEEEEEEEEEDEEEASSSEEEAILPPSMKRTNGRR